MDISQRQKIFKDKIGDDTALADSTRIADAFGISNSAKFIENGVFAFNVNFDRGLPGYDRLVINCLLRFPPEDEIYFSLFIGTGFNTFASRLTQMTAAAIGNVAPADEPSEDDDEVEDEEEPAVRSLPAPATTLDYSSNNKNVKGYIARDGNLYLRNKSYWDSMPDDLSNIGAPIVIDKVLFGLYPPKVSITRSPLTHQFIGYLGSLIGHDKVHEIRAWSDDNVVDPEMRRMPSTIDFGEIDEAVQALGGFYPGGEVQRFHKGLNFLDHKHFVIVQGLSGTGKTQLALKYARAVHGIADMKDSDPFLVVCPVRPEWTDPTALTGYFDVLSNRYIVPPFLEALMLAHAHPDSPVFVVLDEMNLARVEYYFSDVLSCIETGEPLQLHSNSVPLEGTTGTSIPAGLTVPPNLFVVGTINIDETTNPISDKVLDRAMMINMSRVQIPEFLDVLAKRDPDLKGAVESCEGILRKAHSLMAGHGLEFGYRVAEEAVRYRVFSVSRFGSSAHEDLDQLMVQKILVKLRGEEKQRDLLTGLLDLLKDMPASQAFLNRLLEDLNEFGSFQATR